MWVRPCHNSLYHLFRVIWGWVIYCFTHITRDHTLKPHSLILLDEMNVSTEDGSMTSLCIPVFLRKVFPTLLAPCKSLSPLISMLVEYESVVIDLWTIRNPDWYRIGWYPQAATRVPATSYMANWGEIPLTTGGFPIATVRLRRRLRPISFELHQISSGGTCGDFYDYPMVNYEFATEFATENHQRFNMIQLFLWPFSIANRHITRGYPEVGMDAPQKIADQPGWLRGSIPEAGDSCELACLWQSRLHWSFRKDQTCQI